MITLFHKASAGPSVRIANLLKQASAHAAETATEDQASDHSHQAAHTAREPFELDITEATPTPDQLSSILDYVGAGKAGELVKGATSQSDALRKLKENPDSFIRPVVSDDVCYHGYYDQSCLHGLRQPQSCRLHSKLPTYALLTHCTI